MKKMTMELEGKVRFETVHLACNFLQRFMGLMGKTDMVVSEAMLLKTGSVHTFFMRFPIGVIYADESFRILYQEELKPWRIGAIKKGVKYVLEYKVDAENVFPNITGKKLELKISEGNG